MKSGPQNQVTSDELLVLNQELKNLLKERDQSLEEIRNFLSTFAHDLRSPLTVARAGSQLIQKNVSPEGIVNSLSHRVIESIDRVDRMLKDLLDVQLFGAGHYRSAKVSRIHLSSLIEEIIEDFSIIHGDRFIYSTQEDDFYLEKWSRDDLKRVLENLLDNSIKYGRADKKISINLKLVGNRPVILVHNFGEPLPREIQISLFNPFKRSQDAAISNQIGWGLGLSLVKGLVESYQGEVHFISNEEEGTTFIISLS